MGNTMYLVTGAAGFLGGTICRQLVERGDKVRAFVLPGDKAIRYLPAGVEVVEGDLCDMESLERLFTVPEGTETVVLHIASIVTVNPDYNQKVMDVNVGGTRNIIGLCLSHKECKGFGLAAVIVGNGLRVVKDDRISYFGQERRI